MRRVMGPIVVFIVLAMLFPTAVSALEGEIDDGSSQSDTDGPTYINGLNIQDGHLYAGDNEGTIEVDLGFDFTVLNFAWAPSGDYALIVGKNGVIAKLTQDGAVSRIPSGTSYDLWLVSWKPVKMDSGYSTSVISDSYALILGLNGLILKWDGNMVIHVMEKEDSQLSEVEWSDQGGYALIKDKEGNTFRYPPEVDTTPFIRIDSPSAGEIVKEAVTVKGVAGDPDGTIFSVGLRIDDGDWTRAHGTSSWKQTVDVTDLTNGPHKISARSYDGTIFSEPIAVEILVKNNLPPTVEINSPLTGSVVSTQFLIRGMAQDPEGSLESVWIRVDNLVWNDLTNIEDWSFVFDASTYGLGQHIISAMAFDGAHYSSVSCIIVEVREQQLDPTAIILSPRSTSGFTSLDTIGFFAEGDDFGPMDLSYSWSSNIDGVFGNSEDLQSALSPGTHKITVTITDGILEASDTITLNIDEPDLAPTVQFLSPHEGNTIKGIVTVDGKAIDDHRVVALRFKVDSGNWRYLPGNQYWKTSWDTTTVQDGGHIISMMALDDEQQWSEPVGIWVSVDNGKGTGTGSTFRRGNPQLDTGSPTTGHADEMTTTAIVITSTVIAIFSMLGIVESFKVKAIGMFFVPLYSRIKKEKVLDNFTRGAIYGFIVANPGAHYNLIKQELRLNNGAIIYHLDILERKGFINSEKAGIYKRYYQIGHKKEGGLINKLTDIQKRIFLEIKGSPGVSQKEIAKKLNITARALNYHIKTMLKNQLIKLERVGRKTLCFISPVNRTDDPIPAGAL